MSKNFLNPSNLSERDINIFANKSSMILSWLLTEGVNQKDLSLRMVAEKSKVSLGLVHRVFSTLVFKGILSSSGVRTSKTFHFQNPKRLLELWTSYYDFSTRCRMYTFSSGFDGRKQLLKRLSKSPLKDSVALALHSAADAHGYKNTNLTSLELYLLQSDSLDDLVEILDLEPKERGYEVLLIVPYYKSLLKSAGHFYEGVRVSPPLLTFLDLFHFPLRGREQAEHLAKRDEQLAKLDAEEAT